MARCLNCIHFDVCDTDRRERERCYGQCSDFLNDNDIAPKSEFMREIFEELEKLKYHRWDDYSDNYYVDYDDIVKLRKKYKEETK